MTRRVVKLVSTGAGLLLLAVLFVFPFYWMITTSFKTTLEAMQFPPLWLPKEWQWENYAQAWRQAGFARFLLNSVIVTFTVVAGQMAVCVPAAYAFAKKRFGFSKVAFGLILFDMMVPGQVTFIQIYMLLSKAKLIDTYAALTVPFFYSAFGIFFLTNAFRQVPNELIDAARLDRASEMQIIFSVMLPGVMPVVITLAMFTFIGKWNDYFWTLILTKTDRVRTLPMAVNQLVDISDGNVPLWNVSMAGNTMLVAPLLIIYAAANKHIKKAFVYGGIK
jgi:sn-glycerol 3-phosphate transport system permease protein